MEPSASLLRNSIQACGHPAKHLALEPNHLGVELHPVCGVPRSDGFRILTRHESIPLRFHPTLRRGDGDLRARLAHEPRNNLGRNKISNFPPAHPDLRFTPATRPEAPAAFSPPRRGRPGAPA